MTLIRTLAGLLRLEHEREMTDVEVERLLAMPPNRRFYRPIRRSGDGWLCRRIDLTEAT